MRKEAACRRVRSNAGLGRRFAWSMAQTVMMLGFADDGKAEPLVQNAGAHVSFEHREDDAEITLIGRAYDAIRDFRTDAPALVPRHDTDCMKLEFMRRGNDRDEAHINTVALDDFRVLKVKLLLKLLPLLRLIPLASGCGN